MQNLVRSMLMASAVLLGIVAASTANPPLKRILFAEDLGPDRIDVSAYPPEYQETYKKVFLPVFGFLGGTARIINSPILELDPRLEAQERREHPELLSDPAVGLVSKDGWKKEVERILHRPPCCGACPVLSRREGVALWRFLVYDSIARKTGANAASWIALRKTLLERFEKEFPRRYAELYISRRKEASHALAS